MRDRDYRALARFRHALRVFRLQREMLEAKFFDLASTQGKPRGLRWLGEAAAPVTAPGETPA